jgi:hypothetical protein
MILTSAEAKIALGLTSNINDTERALIENFLPKIDAAITKELRYNPQYRVISNGEWYPANEQGYAGDGAGSWEVSAGRAHFAFYGRSDVLQLRSLPGSARCQSAVSRKFALTPTVASARRPARSAAARSGRPATITISSSNRRT